MTSRAPDSARANPLVDVTTLAAELASESPPVLLEVRWRLGVPATTLRDEFAAGHLPGAVLVDLDRALAAAPGVGGRHPLPDLEVFGRAMRAAGVAAARPVVVADEGGGTTAARAWWLLRHHGHPDVRLLDGGVTAWRAAGQRVEGGNGAVPEPGNWEPESGVLPTLDPAGAAALSRQGVLLDARAAERYRGEVEPVDPVAGHIPGAVSAPTTGYLESTGHFLAPDRLRERLATLGVTAGTPVGAYCGSGVTASHTVLALAVAGIDAALYPGSWSGWVTDRSRPVATGPEPG